MAAPPWFRTKDALRGIKADPRPTDADALSHRKVQPAALGFVPVRAALP
jgi:hypothetical protein